MDYRQPAANETEKLETLRSDLRAGITDLEAGRANDAAIVFARLNQRFRKAPPPGNEG
jgi:hypothetical protein